jgi:hypothetical protein
MRRILIIVLSVALSGCGFVRAQLAWMGSRHLTTSTQTAANPAPPPTPADGLWAILDPGCPKPSAPNFKTWPSCASPFWISRGKALVVRSSAHSRRGLTDASYEADYSLAGGDPVIAQVGTQKDGYVFLALTDLAQDNQGRLIGATGAAVACPKNMSGGLALKPNLNGCDTESLDAVRKAAVITLEDRASLTQVAWIAPGAPSASP